MPRLRRVPGCACEDVLGARFLFFILFVFLYVSHVDALPLKSRQKEVQKLSKHKENKTTPPSRGVLEGTLSLSLSLFNI
jgi:hypothetical protein